MAGYRTFNHSNLPLWVTISNMPGEVQLEWGEVLPKSWRPWESGPYAKNAHYTVRGEWPMNGATCDVSVLSKLDGPFVLKPHTFVEWQGRCWWTRPAWRTINTLDRPIWVTIYSDDGDKRLDWGWVAPRARRDWFSGEYGPDAFYRVRAESIPNGADFDIDTRATFEGGWGQATFVKEPGGGYAWHITTNPSEQEDDGTVAPPKELDAADLANPPVVQ